MDYEDLLIELRAEPAGGYSVRMVRSPAGESEAEPLGVPLAPEEIDRLGEAMGRAARDLQRPSPEAVGEAALGAIGDRLFRSLFTGTVRNRYHESLGRVLVPGGSGLRVRIGMGLKNPAMAPLHAIPWEYLRSPEDGHFLSLSRDLSLVRYLDLGLPGERPPVAPPLSILAIAGDDPARSDLALAQEQRALERAWSEGGAVRIRLLARASLEALRDELLAREHHVLHFMGHGGFDPLAGEGSLALCDEDGRRVLVSGAELAAHLRDRTSLRLVFLNACWTARAISSGPYAGVATALVGAGVPAVLAMQFAVSDAAALAFSRSFYRRLARGDTIDAAVTEGRMAIRRLRHPIAEWGTPVLFERLASGRIVRSRSRPRVPVRLASAAALLLVAAVLAVWRISSRPAGGDAAGQSQPPQGALSAQHAPESRKEPHTVPQAAPAPGGGEGRYKKGGARDASGIRRAAPAQIAREAGSHQTSAPRSYTLMDHGAIYIQELSTSVSAEFSQVGREPLLTLHLSSPGSPTVHQAVLGPTAVDLVSGKGRLLVQSIDWDAHTVQLASQPVAH